MVPPFPAAEPRLPGLGAPQVCPLRWLLAEQGGRGALFLTPAAHSQPGALPLGSAVGLELARPCFGSGFCSVCSADPSLFSVLEEWSPSLSFSLSWESLLSNTDVLLPQGFQKQEG